MFVFLRTYFFEAQRTGAVRSTCEMAREGRGINKCNMEDCVAKINVLAPVMSADVFTTTVLYIRM